jgi:hypothetical protein
VLLLNELNKANKNSKRDGLEKAVYRIEQEIKRSKTRRPSEDERNPYHLQSLLTEAQGLLPSEMRPPYASNFHNGDDGSTSYQQSGAVGFSGSGGQSSDDQLPVDDAENPLQLLARATDLSHQTNTTPNAANEPSPMFSTPRPGTGKDQDLQIFFGPFHPSLDVEPETDPIEMGLVTHDEAHTLFQ